MMKTIIQFVIFLIALFLIHVKAGDIQSRLRNHNVDDKTQRAISAMTKSGLSHDVIMKNIQHHFPDKTSREINEIVVASNVATGTKQARGAGKTSSPGAPRK